MRIQKWLSQLGVASRREAEKMLAKISGKTLSALTGFTVMDADSGKRISRSVETKMKIKKLTVSDIKNYVASGEPLDKAGAFAIQGLGGAIVERIEGDYFAVVGLPLSALARTLQKFGIRVL